MKTSPRTTRISPKILLKDSAKKSKHSPSKLVKNSLNKPVKDSPAKSISEDEASPKVKAVKKEKLLKSKELGAKLLKRKELGAKLTKGVQKKGKEVKKRVKEDLMKLAFKEMMKSGDKEKIITRSSSLKMKKTGTF